MRWSPRGKAQISLEATSKALRKVAVWEAESRAKIAFAAAVHGPAAAASEALHALSPQLRAAASLSL